MIWAFAALLVLQPVLETPGELRLVSTGAPEVAWSMDGKSLGTTGPREALQVSAEAGSHTVTAETAHHGAWQVLARLDRPGPGIAYEPAWTASSPGQPPRIIPGPAWPLLVLALLVAAAQSKRP